MDVDGRNIGWKDESGNYLPAKCHEAIERFRATWRRRLAVVFSRQ